MVIRSQSSAAGVLALLQEPDTVFKQHALKGLIPLSILTSEFILRESLYESDDLPKAARHNAALLASKVYYFLGEYDEALSFALGAGSAFQAEARAHGAGEYVETVISNAIDRYVTLRTEEPSGSSTKIDARLQAIIESIFDRCIEEGEYRQAIGIALESHRLDVVNRIYDLTHDVSLLSYTMEAVLDTGFSLSYRDQVLNFLLPLFPPPTSLSKSPHIHALARLLALAYQFAFDLVEGGAREFLQGVKADLPEGKEETQDIYDKLRKILDGQESVKLYLEFLKRNNKVDMLILKNTKVSILMVDFKCH
ncbi:hypothetical protein EV424DRAFT_1547135 [Suillus variegatus]|nr:hypothetical protein EV424DRAFT_1547135 [Suillus variegatus]